LVACPVLRPKRICRGSLGSLSVHEVAVCARSPRLPHTVGCPSLWFVGMKGCALNPSAWQPVCERLCRHGRVPVHPCFRSCICLFNERPQGTCKTCLCLCTGNCPCSNAPASVGALTCHLCLQTLEALHSLMEYSF